MTSPKPRRAFWNHQNASAVHSRFWTVVTASQEKSGREWKVNTARACSTRNVSGLSLIRKRNCAGTAALGKKIGDRNSRTVVRIATVWPVSRKETPTDDRNHEHAIVGSTSGTKTRGR